MTSDSTRAPKRATTFTKEPDAHILAAWDRRKEAFAKVAETDEGSTDEHALWFIIDGAEILINSVAATTVGGAEVQLWCALYHSIGSDNAEVEAAMSADLEYFKANAENYDWSVRFIFAAINSLREQDK